MIRRLVRLVVLLCGLLTGRPVHAQRPDVVTHAAAFAAAIEAALRTPLAVQRFVARYGDDVGPALVDSLLAGVRAHAARAPDDGEVTILVLRLERVRDALARQDPVDAAPPDAAAHLAAVARVLERDPRSAAAHHWKARLLVEGPVLEFDLGGWVPWPVRAGEATAWDAREMLEHARQAVALDSTTALYREFLAIQLALADRLTDALEIVRPVGREDRILQRMLADLAAIGIPDGAVANWPEQAYLFGTAAMAAGDAGDPSYLDWAEVRYRAWTVPSPVDAVEAFYRLRWPGMAFRAVDGDGTRAAVYRASPDALVPVPDSAVLAAVPDGDGEVVELTLRAVGDAGAGRGTTVLLTNGRRGFWEEPITPPPAPVPAVPPDAVPAGGVRVAAGSLSAPLFPVLRDGRLGLIDSLGTVVVEPQFDGIRGVGTNPPQFLSTVSDAGGRDWLVRVLPFFAVRSGQTGLVSAEGIFMPVEGIGWAAEQPTERLDVRRDGKWGFVDAAGSVVIPARYRRVRPFEDGYAFVQEEMTWGVIDRDGRYVVPPTWDDVGGDWGTARWFEVRTDRRAGAVTRAGTTVVPVRFEELEFSRVGLFGVREGGKWGVMDSSGVMLIPPRFDPLGFEALKFPEPGAPSVIGVQEDGRVRYVRFDGSPAFDLDCPSGGSCRCTGDPFAGPNAPAECDGLWGVVDSLGHWLIPPTYRGRITFLNDTLIAFDPTRTRFGGYEPNGGVRTLDGRVLIEPRSRWWATAGDGVLLVEDETGEQVSYVDLASGSPIAGPFAQTATRTEPFEGDHALVTVDELTGLIDRSGNWVLPPVWDRLTHFAGPLALGQRQTAECDVVAEWVNRAGQVVYAMALPRTAGISRRCTR